MNKGKRPAKEPFKPENTPKPPQQVHPDVNKKDPAKQKPQSNTEPPGTPSSGQRGHLLSDQADIDDETTI